MGIYARNTTVSVEKSKGEVERTLTRYGATGFMHGWNGPKAVLMFQAHGKMVRFELTLPSQSDGRFTRRKRSSEAIYKAWEQACRQQWRALALVIKAKLEAVSSGITMFEEEFLAHIVIGKETVGQRMIPHVTEFYKSGKDVPMLGFEKH